MDEPTDRALIVFGDAERARALVEGAEHGPGVPAAAEMFGQWVGRDERRAFGADLALWGALAGDPRYGQYLAAWMHSERHGELYAELHPARPESFHLGRLELVEAEDEDEGEEDEDEDEGGDEDEDHEDDEDDERRAPGRQALREQQRWVSMAWPGGSIGTMDAGIEPTHYRLEVTLRPDEKTLQGAAWIRLRARPGGQRVVELRLMPALRIDSIRDGARRELTWYRDGVTAAVVLADPLAGDELQLEVRWSGPAFRRLMRGIYALRDTVLWYPRSGEIDRATYEVTLRRPRELQLFASGWVDERSGDGEWIVERRRVHVPALAFGFEVGEFFVFEDHVGHMKLTVAFTKHRGALPQELTGQLIDVLKASILFYESQFGGLDVDHLTVVTVPRRFSQGFLGFVTLAHDLTQPGAAFGLRALGLDNRSTMEIRLETLAHEVAHQWWGNRVGWRSDRDQWLSEALADFSAVQLMSRIAPQRPVYLARHAERWQSSLTRRALAGRTFDSLGPVVLGARLRWNHSDDAYSAVVYDKGSVVFRMLASLIGEERFLPMLREIAEDVDHGVIDTAAFLDRVGAASGMPLARFADQYVYGTGIPEVYYEYAFAERPGGGFAIEGHAMRVDGAPFRFRVVRREQGWNVLREVGQRSPEEPTPLVVPFQVAFDGSSPGGGGTEPGLGGRLRLEREITRFSIPLDRRPRAFWLDQRGDVLASFFDERRQPKRNLRHRADQLGIAGRPEQAEMLYRRALEAPLRGEAPEGLAPEDLDQAASFEDVRIRLALARLLLEEGRLEEARGELDLVERSLARGSEFERVRRDVLAARVELQAGGYREAFRRLNEYLRLRPLSFEDQLARSLARIRGQWADEQAEAFALFAIAAHETGRRELAREALRRAEARGVDLEALRGLLD
jgi:hypothetical protein